MNRMLSTDGFAFQKARVTPTFTDPYHRLSSSLTDSRGRVIVNIGPGIKFFHPARKASSLHAGSRETALLTVRLHSHRTKESLAAFMEHDAAAAAEVPDPFMLPIASRSKLISDEYLATWRPRASWSCSPS